MFVVLRELINKERLETLFSTPAPMLLKFFHIKGEDYEAVKKPVGRPNKKEKGGTSQITLAVNYCKNQLLVDDYEATYSVSMINGRKSAKGSVGALKDDIRSYLLGDDFLDFDIVNCFPTLMLYYAKKLDISAPHIEMYVKDRKKFLKENLIDKNAMCSIWNDASNKNNWKGQLKHFRDEVVNLADAMNNDEDTNDIKAFVKSIYSLETVILETVYEKIIKYDVCVKDGFYLLKSKLPKMALTVDLLIAKLNKLTAKYGVKWKNKLIPNYGIILPKIKNKLVEDTSYTAQRTKMNNCAFYVKNPPSIWHSFMTDETTTEFRQIVLADAKTEFAPMTYEEEIETKQGKITVCDQIFPRWLNDKERRQYEGVKFKPYPSKKIISRDDLFYNTFQGLSIWNKMPTDTNEWVNWTCVKEVKYLDIFEIYMRHLVDNNDAKYEYIINYFAHLFQFPYIRPDINILLKGEQGSGKDTLAIILMKIIGLKHSIKSEDPEYIFGHFNADIEQKILICVNELETRDGAKFHSKIKAQTTNDYNQINNKHEKIIREENFGRIIMFSNKVSPTIVELTGRREFITNTGKELLGNEEFWTDIYTCIAEDDFLLTIYKMFMNRNITDFIPRNRPITKEYKQMREKHIPPVFVLLKNECERLLRYNGNIDPSAKWVLRKNNTYATSIKEFKQLYDKLIEGIPHENETKETLAKWKYNQLSGELDRIAGAGFDKVSIRFTDPNTKRKTNKEVWILDPAKLLSYFKKTCGIFNNDEEALLLDDEDDLIAFFATEEKQRDTRQREQHNLDNGL